MGRAIIIASTVMSVAAMEMKAATRLPQVPGWFLFQLYENGRHSPAPMESTMIIQAVQSARTHHAAIRKERFGAKTRTSSKQMDIFIRPTDVPNVNWTAASIFALRQYLCMNEVRKTACLVLEHYVVHRNVPNMMTHSSVYCACAAVSPSVLLGRCEMHMLTKYQYCHLPIQRNERKDDKAVICTVADAFFPSRHKSRNHAQRRQRREQYSADNDR